MTDPVPPPLPPADEAPSATRRCASCGAEMAWDPARQALACDYCGARVELPGQDLAPAEHDLVAALKTDAPRGLGADVRSAHCESCGATVSFTGELTARRCDFCGSPRVLPQSENRNALRPESLLPFAFDRAGAGQRIRKWLGGLWFRPGDLASEARLLGVSGVYVPYWTFDAQVRSDWTADAGYTTVVRVGGRTQRRVRWEHASGSRRDLHDDVLVCASRGMQADLVEGVSGYDTKKLVPYDPGYLAGFKAEEHAMTLKEGWARAALVMTERQRERCSRDVPGDTQRNLEVVNRWERRTFKPVLLPAWVAAYQYGGRTWQVLVNGQTGAVEGQAPWSWVKIALAALAGAALVAFLIWAAGS